VVLVLAALTGCGGRHSAAAPRPPAVLPASCRLPTQAAVADARTLVRQYGGDASPADLAFFELKNDLAFVQSRHCAPAVLGGAFTRAFPPKQLAVLYANLPAAWVRYLRQAVACARDTSGAVRCDRPVTVIEPAGAGKPSGSPHPIAPG
jgi:hypothetical protein